MSEVIKQLLQAHHDLQQKVESSIELIERLKQEGKSMGEIEQASYGVNSDSRGV